MSTIKVMSFNLRTQTTVDGINEFFGKRKDRVIETIFSQTPDLIGFQEVTDDMGEFITRAIESDYLTIGTGRCADRAGESTMIAYNKNKFCLLSLETKWLSETPDVPGSRFSQDQSHCPRIYTMAEFVEKESRSILRMVNTHLDHIGESARLCGAVQIVSRISLANKALPCLNIITGDMNARPDAPAVSTFEKYFENMTRDIGPTFHAFGKRVGDDRPQIDYIFSDGRKISAYAIKDIPVDGVYISDHYPVCAEIEF